MTESCFAVRLEVESSRTSLAAIFHKMPKDQCTVNEGRLCKVRVCSRKTEDPNIAHVVLVLTPISAFLSNNASFYNTEEVEFRKCQPWKIRIAIFKDLYIMQQNIFTSTIHRYSSK